MQRLTYMVSETNPTRAHHADLNDKQSSDNGHDAEPGCCVCEREVTKDTETILDVLSGGVPGHRARLVYQLHCERSQTS